MSMVVVWCYLSKTSDSKSSHLVHILFFFRSTMPKARRKNVRKGPADKKNNKMTYPAFQLPVANTKGSDVVSIGNLTTPGHGELDSLEKKNELVTSLSYPGRLAKQLVYPTIAHRRTSRVPTYTSSSFRRTHSHMGAGSAYPICAVTEGMGTGA